MPHKKTGSIWIILGMVGSIPLVIYGAVQNHKWKMEKLAESIKEGLREGLSDQEKKI